MLSIMKKFLIIALSLLAAIPMVAASIDLRWTLVANDTPQKGIVTSQLVITNNTPDTLTASGQWFIGYCWMSVHPYTYEGAELIETEVCATYHTLRPSPAFRPLLPGESRSYTLLQQGAIIRENGGPQGAFFLRSPMAQPEDVTISSQPFSSPNQWLRENQPTYASGEWLYAYNQEALCSPYQVEKPIAPEEQALDAAFRPLNLVPQPKVVIPAAMPINLSASLEFKPCNDLPAEGYRITFLRKKNIIEYTDEIGRFYALQTLARLQENIDLFGKDERPYLFQLQDWPDLPHRGLMLDIARNYLPKEEIIRLLRAMANYKMNVLHFHIADDEGWRLEIPGLAELTEVGAQRGYTTDESTCLYPAYCGGWDPKAPTTASGFLTRSDYIDLVRIADSLHIRIIPEIEMPGHARAAIRSMEARYRRLLPISVQEAEAYRLIDPADTSRYSSAQYYTDNVICIARPSAYRFVCKIIDEIAAMHTEAGAPLRVLHVGGDEVAHGAFEGSPLCQATMQERGFTHTYQLKDYFLQQIIDYLRPMGIQIAGWEEIAMRGNQPNPTFANSNVLSWCWNSIPEWKGDEKPYMLANAGYPVILACVGNNYIDMSYTNHQSERGLHWGGYTDERSTFDFLPYDIYRSVRYTLRREKRDIDAYDAAKTLRLRPDAVQNIVGINGQLFS